jgi:hypothetical protein
MIFVGYEKGSKAFRAYDPITKRVTITRDVIFDEVAQWDWSTGSEASDGGDQAVVWSDFSVQYRVVAEDGDHAGQRGQSWNRFLPRRLQDHLLTCTKTH